MTIYKIDANRGDDSNDGITAPWASLSKITSVTGAAGDYFLLAADSEFNLSARILLNSALGWSSSVFNPIRFGAYYPSGVNTGRPIIRKRTSIAAGSWTYSAPNNAWTYTASNTISSYAYVKCGGQWATRTDNALPLDSVDGRWSNSGSTLYVYAPSGTNPTAYYGSVVLGGDSSDAAFVVSSPGSVAAFHFEGWRFEEVGTGIYVFNSTGNRTYRIDDMQAEETGCVFYMLTQTSGAVDYEISNVVATEGGTALIGAYGQSGVGISRWVVRNNTLSNCNKGFPQGAVYSQVQNAIIKNNYIRAAHYGVNGKQSDGAGIYTETGSHNNIISGNLIEDCYLATQDNSGKTTKWTGNIIRNCYAASKISDANSNQAVDFTWTHNTVVNAGYPITPVAGSVAGIGILAFTETDPAMNFTIRNNIFGVDAAAPSSYAIELPANAAGTISHNNVVGFTGEAEIYGGGTSPVTPTNTVTTAPALNPSYMPMSSSVRTAGTYLGGGDFYGKSFGNTPTIGAVQYQAARSLTTRTVGSRSVASRDLANRRVITV